MDTRDGRIYEREQVERMDAIDRPYMQEMDHPPTPYQRAAGRVGRNDFCPCGSGKKFKKCCLFKKGEGK